MSGPKMATGTSTSKVTTGVCLLALLTTQAVSGPTAGDDEWRALAQAVNSDSTSTWRAEVPIGPDGHVPVRRLIPLDQFERDWAALANENHVSNLDLHGLGWNLGWVEAQQPIALPASFDWRDHALGGCIQTVGDQGGCGSCYAFASTGVLGERLCIKSNGNINVRLSPQDMVSCGGTRGCEGATQPFTWNYLKDPGAILARCIPYTNKGESWQVMVPAKPCNRTCADGNSYESRFRYKAESYMILMTGMDYFSLSDEDRIEVIKREIYTNGPVQMGIRVFSDFNVYRTGVYEPKSTKEEGGHAMQLIGWGDGYWIIKNSWGEGWGMGGFGYYKMDIDNYYLNKRVLVPVPVEAGPTEGPIPTFGQWGSWGPCSASCGRGLSTRTRICTSWPHVACPLSHVQSISECNRQECLPEPEPTSNTTITIGFRVTKRMISSEKDADGLACFYGDGRCTDHVLGKLGINLGQNYGKNLNCILVKVQSGSAPTYCHPITYGIWPIARRNRCVAVTRDDSQSNSWINFHDVQLGDGDIATGWGRMEIGPDFTTSKCVSVEYDIGSLLYAAALEPLTAEPKPTTPATIGLSHKILLANESADGYVCYYTENTCNVPETSTLFNQNNFKKRNCIRVAVQSELFPSYCHPINFKDLMGVWHSRCIAVTNVTGQSLFGNLEYHDINNEISDGSDDDAGILVVSDGENCLSTYRKSSGTFHYVSFVPEKDPSKRENSSAAPERDVGLGCQFGILLLGMALFTALVDDLTV